LQKTFINKQGDRVRLPIDRHLSGGKGEQHWLDKGFMLPEQYQDAIPDQDLRNVIPDGAWDGRRCFIVGGGPSLKGFDWSLLKGELTIAVNRSFEYFDPTILFSADPRFWRWCWDGSLGAKTTALFNKFKGTKVGVDNTLVFPASVKTVKGAAQWGWSLADGIATGGNSGYAALNLAVCLQADPIYLLGFDMEGKDGEQAWFHDGYPTKNSGRVYAEYAEVFSMRAQSLKERGVRVVNLNPASKLDCFEFGEFPIAKTFPLVVAHYTQEYAGEVEKLRASCERFGLEYEFTPIESLGSWRANSNYCCRHIQAMLDKHQRPVLRVDADAIFRKYPLLFNTLDTDVAAHIRAGTELLGGTLYFNNTPKARTVLEKWITLCDSHPRTSNQVLLHKVVKNYMDGARFTDLPKEYTKIFDSMKGDPVIEHMQASRRLKGKVR
jgi:hypothetical protein